MIHHMRIQNFVLIDSLELDLQAGLTIFTGETGAGKSLVMEAIDLAFGKKVTKNYLKNPDHKAVIEMTLSASEQIEQWMERYGIDCLEDKTIVLSREITVSGTKSRLNGSLINTTYLKELRGLCVEICGQHASQFLLSSNHQLEVVDLYAKNDALKKEYKYALSCWKELNQKIVHLMENKDSYEKQIDFLTFQIQEIESASILSVTEDEQITNELKVLEKTDTLKEVTASAYYHMTQSDFGSSPLDAMMQVKSNLFNLTGIDKDLDDMIISLESSVIDFEDTLKSIHGFSEKVDHNPEKLAILHDRFNELNRIKRKYGPSLEDVQVNLAHYKQELDQLQTMYIHIDPLLDQLDVFANQVYTKATELSKNRCDKAYELEMLIKNELTQLCLPNPIFKISVDCQDISLPKPGDNLNQYHLPETGIDTIDMVFSANPGQKEDSINKIASGGELSRIMLAIKSVLLEQDSMSTVIFDEIDSGTSGQAAQSIAERMLKISRYSQILYITHQVIVAAMADHHYHITKEILGDESTAVSVQKLTREERKRILAELASGLTDDHDAVNLSEKLLSQAEKYKFPV